VLQVEHPETGVLVELRGEVVFVQPEGSGKGVGIELTEPDLPALLGAFDAIIDIESAPPPISAPDTDVVVREAVQVGRPSGEILLPLVGVGATASEPTGTEDPAPGADGVLEINAAPRRDSLRMGPEARRAVESAEGKRSQPPENVHLRVRKLPVAARERVARSGNLAERTALERAFGGSVWEALLQNAQITGAEVARIAKNGTAPATILGQIVNHGGWLARPEVRRALLQNRRLPAPQIDAVLRATPQNELRLMVKQAGYPPRVREAAKRFLRL
jgi:hypothetical protein